VAQKQKATTKAALKFMAQGWPWAHPLPSIATNFFTLQASCKRVKKMIGDGGKG